MLYYLETLLRGLDLERMQGFVLEILAVLLCLSVHETCHGLAALALGDPTARAQHRLSLNPLRHIDWLGLAMLLMVGIGWAKPVSVDPRYFKRPKLGMALTALAGPASNILLAILSLQIGKVIYLYTAYAPWAQALFDWCVVTLPILSLGLGLFNLLPIPPLDGSKVLAMVLPDRAYGIWMRYERYGFLLLLAISWLGIGGDLLGRVIQGAYLELLKLFFG